MIEELNTKLEAVLQELDEMQVRMQEITSQLNSVEREVDTLRNTQSEDWRY